MVSAADEFGPIMSIDTGRGGFQRRSVVIACPGGDQVQRDPAALAGPIVRS